MEETTFNWIDISATLSDGMVRWPDDPPVHITKAEEMNKGDEANVTKLETTAHVGTHIDAPMHFVRDGMDVASVPLETLVGVAKVFHITNPLNVDIDDVRHLDIKPGDRVLFRTRNSETDWERRPFMEDYVYLSTDAAHWLAEKKVRCVGIDYISLGNKENNPEVHRLMLGTPVIIIEGLKLRNITAGEYDMVCLPLKIENSDGGPARVIIRRRS